MGFNSGFKGLNDGGYCMWKTKEEGSEVDVGNTKAAAPLFLSGTDCGGWSYRNHVN